MANGEHGLTARLLLGWMDRDQAVQFLTTQCVQSEGFSAADAEGLWRPFRARVDALAERPRVTPAEQKLSNAEREHAREFLRRVKKINSDVSRIVKVDLRQLAAYQLFVLTDRSAVYRNDVCSWKGWKTNCLRPHPASRQIPTRHDGNVVTWELPHAEFIAGVAQKPNGPELTITERPKWVTVTPCDGRLLLWAGYHRSFARISHDDPAIGERAVPVVRVENLVGPPKTDKVTVATGLRPPLFGDFLDRDFFMEVELRRKRYEIRATFNGDQVSISPVLQFVD